MISKRFESTAMVDRLQHVGKLLDDTDAKSIRLRLDSWLDENREIHKKLLSFLESGMVHDMLAGSTGKRLPRSCVRMKLVSAQVTMQCLQRQNPAVNSSSLKNAKGKDKKASEKLMYFAGGLVGSSPMRGGLAVPDFLALWCERCAVYGNRLSRVSIDGSGLIDWSAQGVYGFARAGGNDVGTFALLAGPDIKTATHIVHKFSEDAVALSELGVGKIDEKWQFASNWSEEQAQLSNGKRMRVSLWDDFKNGEYFKYSARHKVKYPESEFAKKIGEKAKEDLQRTTTEAMQAVAGAQIALKKAGLASMATPTPLKKRRRTVT